MTSQSNTQARLSGYFLLVFALVFVAGICVLLNMASSFEKELGFDFSGNCLAISEAAKDLSRVRDDGFVIDAHKLHAFYNTKQPISFWVNGLAGELYLTEGKDYVVIEGDKEKQWLLTIDATRGMAAKSVESSGGFFEKQDARVAKRLLACLQEPHFLKF